MADTNHASSQVPAALDSALREFSDHIRDPSANAPAADIEDRRLAIYRDLFYNNIEGFISGAFPVLRSICADDYWHEMVRDFMAQHRAKTPYFLEIAEEFLQYLSLLRVENKDSRDPVYLMELAHYEWVELALDVSTEAINCKPVEFPGDDLLEYSVEASPLAWCLSYVYPVHRIGPELLKTQSFNTAPELPTHLIVYRNRQDEVGFMEASAVTLRLLQLLQTSPELSLRDHLGTVAAELQLALDGDFLNHAIGLLQTLHRLDILLGFHKPA